MEKYECQMDQHYGDIIIKYLGDVEVMKNKLIGKMDGWLDRQHGLEKWKQGERWKPCGLHMER